MTVWGSLTSFYCRGDASEPSPPLHKCRGGRGSDCWVPYQPITTKDLDILINKEIPVLNFIQYCQKNTWDTRKIWNRVITLT